MATVEVKINGLDRLQRNLKRYPDISRPLLARAINASLAEVNKRADDSDGGIFQFATPRMRRTGFLARSFDFGTRLATPSNLQGSVGPTVKYALNVHRGISDSGRPTRRGANPFMERIARASQSSIQAHFDTALDKITRALA
jgi:hypothetical protein